MSLFIPLRGAGLHPAITFTRASDAYRRIADDANGERWEVMGGNDRARIHSWDGVAAHNGLLIEPARINYALRSDAFDVAPWVETGTAITANQYTAPDGTLVGDACEDDNAGGKEYVTQQNMGLNLTVHQASCFGYKISGAVNPELYFATGGAGSETIDFPLTGLWGRVTTDGGGNAVANTNTAKIRAYPVSETGAAADLGLCAIWGAQVEEGSYPTSYISTAGMQVTRAGDACPIAVGALSGLISTSYGRIKFVWVPGFDQGGEAGIVQLFALRANAYLAYDGSDDRFVVYTAGVERLQTAVQTFTANSTVFILDWVWNGTTTQLSVIKDGTAQAGVTGVWTPPPLGTNIWLGHSSGNTAHATGTYSDLYLGF